MDECVDILEKAEDALPSDRLLCAWVKGQHLAEEVGHQFAMEDTTMHMSITDPKMQYALRGFERQLDDWKEHTKDLKQRKLVDNQVSNYCGKADE
jgi:hypothetical protein